MWLSVDPMSDKYPSMSPYNYCANNPIILVDPDGREIILPNENSNLSTISLVENPIIDISLGDVNKGIGNIASSISDYLFADNTNKKVSARSLGLKKSQNAEQILSILFSKKMEKGDYIEGSEFNFFDSYIGKAIDKIVKTSDNTFVLSFTWLARTLAKTSKLIDIESENVTVTISKRNGGGYNLLFKGLKYDGTNLVYILNNQMYWTDKKGAKWYTDLKEEKK